MIASYTLALTVRAPILSRSNAIGLFGIDAPIARLPDGRPYLPGTLVIGRLAEALRHLGEMQKAAGVTPTCHEDLRRFFGWTGGDKDGDAERGRERRRRIFSGDLVADDSGAVDDETLINSVRTRVAIDDAAGTVLEGAIQAIESPWPVGTQVDFRGALHILGTENEIACATPRLEKALAWISQWGALRGQGYGTAVAAVLERAVVAEKTAASTDDSVVPKRFLMVLDLKDPYCVGDRRIAANLYESGEAIPGGVIKGATAAQIRAGSAAAGTFKLSDADFLGDEDLAVLAAEFDNVLIRHAAPIKRGQPIGRPFMPVPLSLAFGDNDVLVDAARLNEPGEAFLIDGTAPTFAPDWKPKQTTAVEELIGRTRVPEELRVRTKIDDERRAADSGNLFAINYRRPDGHVFVAEVELSSVAEKHRAAVTRGLQRATADGLAGIGRGGAYATVEFPRKKVLDPAAELPTDGRVVLILRTHALLRRPDPDLRGDVTDAYREAFSALASGKAPNLLAVFVGERLAGAEFLANRLRDRDRYAPFLLTEAGSVFVFEIDGSTRKTVKDWLRGGLRVPAEALAAYGLQNDPGLWQYCPYLPQNGYGEIAILQPIPGTTIDTDRIKDLTASDVEAPR